MGIRYIPPGKKSYKKPLVTVSPDVASVEADNIVAVATETVTAAQAVIEEAAQHLAQEPVVVDESVTVEVAEEKVEPVTPQPAVSSSTVNAAKRKK